MRYCRFLLDGHIDYGVVEERGGELWITGPAPAPEEDLRFRLAQRDDDGKAHGFEPMPLSAAALLPPVTPSKML